MLNKTTREQIIESADQLFYKNGYENTSFADIANSVKISRGNFYHHFKTKDEILNSVIDLRLFKTKNLLDRWESENALPENRIKSFIHILITNMAKIKNYGCPVGTLSSELAKLEHASQQEANKLFTCFREWLRKQFIELGREKDADKLAMHILARSQGIATLANAFKDEPFIKHEVALMNEWLKQQITSMK